jgi:cytochrome c oxidase subunit IV
MKTRSEKAPSYVAIWLVLMVLLGLTCGLAQLRLGRWAVLAALGIAFLKMLLVILYFMHVRRSPRLTWIFVAAGFVWLGILFDLSLSDYLTRGSVPAAMQNSWKKPLSPANWENPLSPKP